MEKGGYLRDQDCPAVGGYMTLCTCQNLQKCALKEFYVHKFPNGHKNKGCICAQEGLCT